MEFATENDINLAIEKNQSNYALSLEREKRKVKINFLFVVNLQKSIKEHKPVEQETKSDNKIDDLQNCNPNSNSSHQKDIKDDEPKTLESFFKKTSTKPHIYYLPLTEEEVLIILINI